MDLKDIPIAGTIGGTLASVADVVFYGGDYIIDFAFFVLGTIDLWLPFMSRLASVAQAVEWLPEDHLQKLVLGLTVLFVLVYGYRLVKRWIQKKRQ